MQQSQDTHRQGQFEGSFRCAIEGADYHYLVSYEGGRSVNWHATIRRGSCFTWSSGTLNGDPGRDATLAEAVRAQVLAGIGVMGMS